MGDLVGAERAADAGPLRVGAAAGRVRRDVRCEEGAVDDELTAAGEQVGEADGAVRPLEPVVLVDRRPRHPPALGGHRVAGPGELLLLDQELLAGGLPLL